ncbi:hypothetical protein GQ53DRAFT_890902 [Thozetella sp. PMI_491]|nr:hypothetical protein GQ53DRAFT_890902 [Thozetella sp. PMI_491]
MRRPPDPHLQSAPLNVDHRNAEEHDGLLFGSREKASPRKQKGSATYKPTALKVPFIVCQIVVLCIAIGLVAYAERAMPNSDSDAKIVARRPQPAAHYFRAIQANFSIPASQTSTSSAQDSTSSSLTETKTGSSLTETQTGFTGTDGFHRGAVLSTGVSEIVSFFTTNITRPASTFTYTTVSSGTRTTSHTVAFTTTSTVVATSTSLLTTVKPLTLTSIATGDKPTRTGPISVGQTTETHTSYYTTSNTIVTTFSSVVVTEVPETTTQVVTSTAPGTVYQSVGAVTVTYSYIAETSEVVVTTPTGGAPITLTLVSSSGGTLTTLTRTFAPTTRTSTNAETRTTTSTPSPTSVFSTRSRSTQIFTSTASATGTSTAENLDKPTIVTGTKVFVWSESDIFLGTFLPTMLAVILAIPLRIIDLNAKLYQPFQALTAPGGALGSDSMTLEYSGFMGFVTPFLSLLQGHPVPFITTLLVGTSSLAIPLSAEAISLKIHGTCQLTTGTNTCAVALGVSFIPANILICLLAITVVMLCLLLFLLRRWNTGVHANPWNIAGMASLARSPATRIRQTSDSSIRRAVSQKQYMLAYFKNSKGQDEYGIVLADESSHALHDDAGENDAEPSLFDSAAALTTGRSATGRYLPFMPLRYPWRIVFFFFLTGLFVFIIYYNLNKFNDERVWRLMNAYAFGTRFIFAALGVLIAFSWQSFFLSVSIIVPYQLMARRSREAGESILMPRPTNPFSGIYAAAQHKHLYWFATSLMAILSDFLPILLSNVPFSLGSTQTSATICALMSIIILGLMMITMAASTFIKWPAMPVSPQTIAGAMYYVSQSRMLHNFEGISMMNSKDREKEVKAQRRRYYYGMLESNSAYRLGVDEDLGPRDTVVTEYFGPGAHRY